MKEECKYVLTMFGEHFATEKNYSYNVGANTICKEIGYDTGWLLLLVVVL